MTWIEIIAIVSVITLIFIILGVLLWFYFRQELMIFKPEKLPPEHRFNFGHPAEERFYNPTGNIQLHALHFRVEKPKGVVLYFHGNAGSNASWGLVHPHFVERNWDLVIYDYRGYGKSNGNIFKQPQLLRDATFVAKSIYKEYKDIPIIYYGRSLGSGIATFVARKIPPSKLVLSTPYFNFKDLVKHYYPFIPTRIILKYTLQTNKWLERVDVPVYIVHGTKDELVPFESSIRLEKLNAKAKLIPIHGANHSTYTEANEYEEFLDKILGEKIN